MRSIAYIILNLEDICTTDMNGLAEIPYATYKEKRLK